MLHVVLSFLSNSQHAFRSMDISKLHTKCLSVVILKSKNEIEYLLLDRSCLWLEIIFASYATRNGTLTLLNIKRYHWNFIHRYSLWNVKVVKKVFFRNYIIKESDALDTIPLEGDVWFIDGMALISCLKPKKLIQNGFRHWSGSYPLIVL